MADHAALLARYVSLVRSRNRGDDMLDEFSGLHIEDRVAIRRIADQHQPGPTGPAVERIGGTSKGKSWCTELNIQHDREAAAAWGEKDHD